MAQWRARCPQCGTHFDVDADSPGPITCPSCNATLSRSGARRRGLVGQTLGQFQILERLGRGGMGSVYKARQVTLDRPVAVKVLRRSLARNEAFVARFQREARSAAAIKHPNIVDMIDVGEARGRHFIAMELIEGENLKEILWREGRLSAQRALPLLRQVAAALAKAHAAGVCHRDIKPANILVTADGTAKVADFGLAKRTEIDVSVTQSGTALGTPLYMPPEVARGQAHDARSDLYSLGATFYRVLAGEPPFSGKTSAELVVKHIEAEVPPLRTTAPDCPIELTHVVHRLMRKNPAGRYESAEQLMEALDDVEAAMAAPAEQTPATEEPPAHPHRRPSGGSRRQRIIALAVIAALAATAVVLAIVLSRKDDASDRHPQTRRQAERPAATSPPPPEPKDENPSERPPPKPEPKPPKSKPRTPKRKLRQPPWEDAWQKAVTQAKELGRQGRFGDAAEVFRSLQERFPSPRLKVRTERAIQSVHNRAKSAYRELERHVNDLIDAGALDQARDAIEPVVEHYGVESIVQEARIVLGEIENRQRNAQRLQAWERIRQRSEQLLEAGQFAQAEAVLEEARDLPLRDVAERIAQQVGRIHDARRDARQQVLTDYQRASDAVWALLQKGRYDRAQQRIEELAADGRFTPAAERLAADRAALRLLREFWTILEQRLAKQTGQFVALAGAAGNLVKVEDGTVTVRAGEKTQERDIHKFNAKQALHHARLGRGLKERLLEGVFRLAQREGLEEAAACLDAAAKNPPEGTPPGLIASLKDRLARLREKDAARR